MSDGFGAFASAQKVSCAQVHSRNLNSALARAFVGPISSGLATATTTAHKHANKMSMEEKQTNKISSNRAAL